MQMMTEKVHRAERVLMEVKERTGDAKGLLDQVAFEMDGIFSRRC